MVVVGKGQGAGGVRRRKALGGAHVRITNYELRITNYDLENSRATRGEAEWRGGNERGGIDGDKRGKSERIEGIFSYHVVHGHVEHIGLHSRT